MEIHEVWEQLLVFMRNNDELIELIIFCLAFAESIIFASVFVPSSIIFIAVGALEGAANGPLLAIVIAGALGAFAGDVVSFVIGGRMQGRLSQIWPLNNHPELLTRTKRLFEKWGALAIIASKLLGPLRPILPMLAGASHMPWKLFAVASLLSSIIWSTLLFVPAYYGLQLVVSATS